jgi:hypothetical protein
VYFSAASRRRFAVFAPKAMVERHIAIACQGWFVAAVHDEFSPFMVTIL